MRGIVDRFEGEFVVIEIDGKTTDIARDQVDPNVREGDVVQLIEGIWKSDPAATEERSRKIQKLMEQLWED